jgi:hypothetical protein
MASPDMYDEAQKAQLRDHLLEQASISKQLDLAEEQWLDLSTQLEEMTCGQ